MKGKSIIELRDVHTGKVQRHIDQNLVTNGMKVFPGMAVFGATPLTSNQYFPLWKNWFSGLKLFENPLDENPDSFTHRYSDTITGYASNTADTSDPKRGLFNVAESGPLEDNSGVRLVWDFAQNQANGQISCISIVPNISTMPENQNYIWIDIASNMYEFTPLSDGSYPEAGTASYSHKETYMVDYSAAERVATFVTRADKASGNITIIQCLMEMLNISPAASYTMKIINETTVEIPEWKTASGDRLRYIQSSGEHWYMVCNAERASQDKIDHFYLFTIDKKTCSVSVTMISLPYSDTSRIITRGVGVSIGDELYVKCSGGGDFKVNAVTKEVEAIGISIPDVPVVDGGEILGLDGTVIDTGMNSIMMKVRNKYTSYGSSNGEDYFLHRLTDGIFLRGGVYIDYYSIPCTGVSIMADTRILYTINNLSAPIVKTADKTMKITYLLTYE